MKTKTTNTEKLKTYLERATQLAKATNLTGTDLQTRTLLLFGNMASLSNEEALAYGHAIAPGLLYMPVDEIDPRKHGATTNGIPASSPQQSPRGTTQDHQMSNLRTPAIADVSLVKKSDDTQPKEYLENLAEPSHTEEPTSIILDEQILPTQIEKKPRSITFTLTLNGEVILDSESAAAANPDWWVNMTPAMKKQYIEDHPLSKFAKYSQASPAERAAFDKAKKHADDDVNHATDPANILAPAPVNPEDLKILRKKVRRPIVRRTMRKKITQHLKKSLEKSTGAALVRMIRGKKKHKGDKQKLKKAFTVMAQGLALGIVAVGIGALIGPAASLTIVGDFADSIKGKFDFTGQASDELSLSTLQVASADAEEIEPYDEEGIDEFVDGLLDFISK